MFLAQGKRGTQKIMPMFPSMGFGNNMFFNPPQQQAINPMMLGAQLMPKQVHIPSPVMPPQFMPNLPQQNILPSRINPNPVPQFGMQQQFQQGPMQPQMNMFQQQQPSRFGFQQQQPQPFGFGFGQIQQPMGFGSNNPMGGMGFGSNNGMGFGSNNGMGGMGFGFR
jgi:hypothetical protein